MSFQAIFNSINKSAAAMLTPEAQQTAVQPPEDPAMMGGAPAGAPPMDPAMAQGGAPMDPAAMGGMPPGAMPPPAPAGQPGAWMQDPTFMQFLQQMGVQVQPDGTAVGPDGQPVPSEMMDQIYAQFQQEMAAAQGGGMPPGGAPMDPAAMGGMPPEGVPPEGEMPPEAPAELPEEVLNQVAGVVQQVVDATVEEKISALDKKLTAFTDKIDAIKMLLDDILVDNAKADKTEAEEGAAIDDEIERDLANARGGEDVSLQPTEQMIGTEGGAPAQSVPNMLDIMRGNA